MGGYVREVKTHKEEGCTFKLAIADALLEGKSCDGCKEGADEPEGRVVIPNICWQ